MGANNKRNAKTTTKEHYKMYKKGRNWLFAGVMVLSWQVSNIDANADTTTDSSSNDNIATIDSTTSSDSNSVTLSSTATSATTNTVEDSTSTATSTATSKSAAATSATSTTATTTSTATSAASATSSATKTATSNATSANSESTAATTTATSTNDQSSTTTNNETQVTTDDSTTDTTVTTDTQNTTGSDATNTDQEASSTEDNSTPEDATVSDMDSVATTDTVTSEATNDLTTEKITNVVADSPKEVTTASTTTNDQQVTNKRSTLAKAAADATDIASGTFGTSDWRIDSTGVLHLGAGTFADTTNNTSPWAAYLKQITSISFDGKVTGSANSAGLFKQLNQVTTITNTNQFDTSKVTNMCMMFENASSLTSLDLSSWDTSNVTNMEEMFTNANSLTSIGDVSNWDTSKVTTMSLTFAFTSSLSVDLSGWDVSSVTTMLFMFSSSGVTSIGDVSHWKTGNVTTMKHMFVGSDLTELDASHWDTSNVTTMEGMFNSTRKLTTLDVSHWNTSKVTTMENMFSDVGLTTLNVSNWDTGNVTSMHNMFYASTGIKMLDVSNWDTSKVTDMKGMFYNSTSLTTLDVSKWNTGNVTTMESMFYNASSLKALDVSNWDVSNVTTMANMFVNVSSVKMLDVSNWDISKVTNVSSMFSNATSLLALDLSGWNLGSVKNISNMLGNTTSLQTLVLGANTNLHAGTSNVSLPNLKASNSYTGKWVGVNSGTTYTTAELMAGGRVTADTYIWQKVAKGSSILEANDSTVVAGPTATWNAKDSVVSAVDIDGSDASDKVTVAGTVNPNKTGVYNVVLNYVDSNGETVSKLIRVTVVASQADFDVTDTSVNQKPDTSTSTWKPSDSFGSLTDGAGNQIDNADITFVTAGSTTKADTTGKTIITVSGDTVDNSKPGIYNVTYSYTDAGGNVITKTIAVTVVESKATLEVTDQTLTQNETWNPESGITAGTDFDGNSIDFKDVVVSGDKVDTSKTGTYNVIYTYTDAEGNEITKTVAVTVEATTANVNGENQTLTQNETWNAEAGFTSGVDEDGNVLDFDQVTVGGDTVDTSKTGIYHVTYSYTDQYGNTVTKEITVTVEASKASVNVKDVTVTQGSTWNAEAGFVSGTDINGSSIEFTDVKVSGDVVDTNTPGTYEVTYTYTDKYGNEVSQTITVTVEATKASVNAKDTTVIQGSTWNAEDGFVSGTDVDGNAISFNEVTVSGDKVDTSKPGTYSVTYTYTDKYNNVVSQTIIVTVEASKASVNAKDTTVMQGSTWNDADGFVSGTDADGNAIGFADVTVSGDFIDTSKPGTYQVTYTYTDKYGNKVSQTITIIVEATKASVNVKDTTVTQGSTWNAEDNFVGGTDVDGNAINFNEVTVSGDKVDTNTPGAYSVTYTYTDKYGNKVAQTVTVTVVAADTEATIVAKDTTVTQNSTWNAEAGFVSGTDADGNAISFVDVKVGGDTVDTSKTGTYQVTYTYTDKYGNQFSQTVTVTVVATTANVNGEDKTIIQNSTWNDEHGFVGGTDVDGNAISFEDVIVSGDTVDTSQTGTYTVIYSYTDKHGNVVSYTITVTVTVTTANVNAQDKTVTQGSTWNHEHGFVGGTDVDGNAISFEDVIVSGDVVDTSKLGTYTVVYSYTDKHGNVVSYTITVTVAVTTANVNAKDTTVTQGDTWNAEAGFVAGEDVDGNAIGFEDVVVSGDKVDTSKPGTYQVTYNYTDKHGNKVSHTVTVTVVAANTEASVNAKDTTVTQGSTWDAEAGFVSGTDADGNLISFEDVKISGDTVDTSKTGTYNVTYTYTDKYGNVVSKTIMVTVEATTANLNAKDTTVNQGSTWNAEAGFVGGTDVDGNAISFDDVIVSGDIVDTKKLGTYHVIYSYIDKYGNLVSQTITVTVVAADTKASIVAKDTTLTQGSTWNAEAGFVSGTDADGNAISFADVQVSGDTVDTSKTGTYQVTYTYTDKYGNEVSQTITVTVTAKDTGDGDNNGGTDTDNNGDGDNNGGTDTDNNGDNNGGTDTDNNGDGDNNGGTDTDNSGDGDNNGGTDTDNNGDGNNNGGTDTGNNGDTETTSEGNTINDGSDTTSNTVNTSTTTNGNGAVVDADYQTGSTKANTVKLSAKTKGTTVDQIAKGNLPQTDETTQSSASVMGLALLGFSSMLGLAGVKRRRTDK